MAGRGLLKTAAPRWLQLLRMGKLSDAALRRITATMPEGQFRYVRNLGRGQFNLADEVAGNIGGLQDQGDHDREPAEPAGRVGHERPAAGLEVHQVDQAAAVGRRRRGGSWWSWIRALQNADSEVGSKETRR
mgnify:CR=1 FL=1